MIWLRKRLVAWLMPEIDRVQRVVFAAGADAAKGVSRVVGECAPDLIIPTGQALPPRQPRNWGA